MTHPLTDEMCEQLVPFLLESRHDYQEMRAAADWQLEQVIIQWEEVNSLDRTDTQVIREFDKRLLAMRPQEES